MNESVHDRQASALMATTDPLTRRVIADMAATYGVPVAFTAQSADPDAILISGPVRLGALLQRIRNHRRRADKHGRLLPLGRFIFDPDQMMLRVAHSNEESDDDVVLTEKETAILVCLSETPGSVIARRDLLARVWGYVEGVETHTLETHIYRLRQKLETDPAKPEILLTEESGYRLSF